MTYIFLYILAVTCNVPCKNRLGNAKAKDCARLKDRKLHACWDCFSISQCIVIRIVSWPQYRDTYRIVTPLINTIILFMKKQLIWVLELRKSVHYWWSSILFSPECKELTSMLDPLLYRWGVPPVVIRCVHWTMQMWVLQTWIIAQGPDILMRCLNFFSWEECRCLFPGRSPRESAETAIWSLLNYFM